MPPEVKAAAVRLTLYCRGSATMDDIWPLDGLLGFEADLDGLMHHIADGAIAAVLTMFPTCALSGCGCAISGGYVSPRTFQSSLAGERGPEMILTKRLP